MPRYLIQSKTTGKFLIPSVDGGEPGWTQILREAGGGVVTDLDSVNQLVEDHCDFDDMPTLVDLDRLGMVNDYTKS